MSRLVKELQGSDFWKLRRAYSPGVQEYVEAATFCRFCRSGSLLHLDEINATLLPLSDPSLAPLQINVLDYLLGLADLTGELMRLAIGRISDGEVEYAQSICKFVRDIYRELTLVAPIMDDSYDMKSKMDTMLQSVTKIENVMAGSIRTCPPTSMFCWLYLNGGQFHRRGVESMFDPDENVNLCPSFKPQFAQEHYRYCFMLLEFLV
ncbi:hypothetical protein TIFTF001_011286 [Ficus carica]|uniref:Translin n=1 Tax=Ficus carica TaxID=3494 RepID=A0AA88ADT0_FICCA|nr:hypothetical protein TIFTF001_011286 [Ficus carica]